MILFNTIARALTDDVIDKCRRRAANIILSRILSFLYSLRFFWLFLVWLLAVPEVVVIAMAAAMAEVLVVAVD